MFVCLLGLQVFSFKQHFTVINDVDFNGRENKQKPENLDIPQIRFLRLNRVQLVTDDNRDSQTLVVISTHGIWLVQLVTDDNRDSQTLVVISTHGIWLV